MAATRVKLPSISLLMQQERYLRRMAQNMERVGAYRLAADTWLCVAAILTELRCPHKAQDAECHYDHCDLQLKTYRREGQVS